MIEEWTTDLPEEQGSRIKYFGGMYGVGPIVERRDANGYDLLEIEVTYDRNITPPDSFSGMSGGGLWRVYCSSEDNGPLSVQEKRLIGIAFYESDLADEKRTITCHGPKSLYGELVDAIRKKWPD